KARLVKEGILTQEEADRSQPGGSSDTEVRDEDFPPEAVEYLREGVEAALASPVPDEAEAEMWVFKE
ncbi:MAG TPA: hypothetical protein PLA92_10990, partial [Fimbriimonadaceae bacterium]|nr:hypothetical protein [Fimbriimonadaceae bacterium]